MFIVKREQTLLSFLKAQTSLSGKALKNALESGSARVNGVIERFASTQLVQGDKVSFHHHSPHPPQQQDILYEEREFVIYNKPTGIVTQGEYLVHRLDKGTSGVLVVAKTPSMQRMFESLFKKRGVHKTYIALASGRVRRSQGRLCTQLLKKGEFHGQSIWGSGKEGVEAITDWKCLKQGRNCALLELVPYTGRTHQLRVHLSEMGHPILGDVQYGRRTPFPQQANRLCLHAYRLVFTHPKTSKNMVITAPIPRLFHTLIDEC